MLVEWGIDLTSEHERYYPKDIKSFYMRLNDDGNTCAAMDRLVPLIGEVICGSQHEGRLDVLDRHFVDVGLDLADYWWYRDLRKYGVVPHAGFGFIMVCACMENIRDFILWPSISWSC